MRESQNFASFKPSKNVYLTPGSFYTSLPSLGLGLGSIICPIGDWKHKLSDLKTQLAKNG
jgi:hypothetical protein